MNYEEYTTLTREEAAAYMRDKDHREIHEWLAEKIGNRSVLDLGCGNGALADHIKHDRYLGVDVSESLVREAERRHPTKAFARRDITGSSAVLRADVVVCKSVLVHLPSREHVSRVLRLVFESARERAIIAWAGRPWSDRDVIQKVPGHFGREVYQNTYAFDPLWEEFTSIYEFVYEIEDVGGFAVWEAWK
jgi:trans-aconitate methyltransferase